jgi:osmotically inducible lipoprotein OsmB
MSKGVTSTPEIFACTPNSKKTRSAAVLATLALTLAIAACGSMSDRDKNTATGAVIGGAAGAILTGGSTAGTVGGAAVGE